MFLYCYRDIEWALAEMKWSFFRRIIVNRIYLLIQWFTVSPRKLETVFGYAIHNSYPFDIVPRFTEGAPSKRLVN